jgi:hypothetical protein
MLKEICMDDHDGTFDAGRKFSLQKKSPASGL